MIDSGVGDEGTRNDNKEEYRRLDCDKVLDPLGGGAFGGDGITPGGGWPTPV